MKVGTGKSKSVCRLTFFILIFDGERSGYLKEIAHDCLEARKRHGVEFTTVAIVLKLDLDLCGGAFS